MTAPKWYPSLLEFVAENPGFLPTGEPVHVPAHKMTPNKFEELRTAHRLMVGARYTTDWSQHGRADVWKTDWNGDCEDKALAAMKWLRDNHWWHQSLWLYIVTYREGWLRRKRGHAVLVAYVTFPGTQNGKATLGAVCLDNRARTPQLVDLTEPNALGYNDWIRVDPQMTFEPTLPEGGPHAT